MIDKAQILKIAIDSQNWELVKLVTQDLSDEQSKKVPYPELVRTEQLEFKNPLIIDGEEYKKELVNIPAPVLTDKIHPSMIKLNEDFIKKTEPSPKSRGETVSSFITQTRRAPIQTEPTIQDGKNYGKKIPFQPVEGINKFQDDLSEETSETRIENPQLAILYGNKKRKKKDPDEVSPPLVDVVCSECKTAEKVPPILSTNYSDIPSQNTYKCNACIQKRIRERKG